MKAHIASPPNHLLAPVTASMERTAVHLTILAKQKPWEGTITALAARFNLKREAAPHLARWLRKKEPELWWTYGVAVSFTRIARRRTVRVTVRDSRVGIC